MNPTNLIVSLRDVLYKLENDNISNEQLELLKEFILKLNFTEFNNDKSEKDLMKYLSVGWYICENIL